MKQLGFICGQFYFIFSVFGGFWHYLPATGSSSSSSSVWAVSALSMLSSIDGCKDNISNGAQQVHDGDIIVIQGNSSLPFLPSVLPSLSLSCQPEHHLQHQESKGYLYKIESSSTTNNDNNVMEASACPIFFAEVKDILVFSIKKTKENSNKKTMTATHSSTLCEDDNDGSGLISCATFVSSPCLGSSKGRRVVWDSEPNTQYLIVVIINNNLYVIAKKDANFFFRFTINEGKTPKNDVCTDAMALKIGQPELMTGTRWATEEKDVVGKSFCPSWSLTDNRGLWYKVNGDGNNLVASACSRKNYTTTAATMIPTPKLTLFVSFSENATSCGTDLYCLPTNEVPCGYFDYYDNTNASRPPPPSINGKYDSYMLTWESVIGITYYIHAKTDYYYYEKDDNEEYDNDDTVLLLVENVPTPSNEVCKDAKPLTLGATVYGNTWGAKSDNHHFCFGSLFVPFDLQRRLWYTVIGTGKTLYATTCSNNNNGGNSDGGKTEIDTEFKLFTGNCDDGGDDSNNDGLFCEYTHGFPCGYFDEANHPSSNTNNDVDADDVAQSSNSSSDYFTYTRSWESIPNETYYIFMQSDYFDNFGIGYFTLLVDEVNRPINDECMYAEQITINVPANGTTLGGTPVANLKNDNPHYYCGSAVYSDTPGVWYKLKGTGDELIVGTCNENITDFDTQIIIFTGYCGGNDASTLLCVDGNDDGCGGTMRSVITLSTTINEIYFILVTGYKKSKGKFSLLVKELSSSPPKNDVCSGAVATALDVMIDGSTKDATFDNHSLQTCHNQYYNSTYSSAGTGDTSNVDLPYLVDDKQLVDVWYTIVGTGRRFVADVCNFGEFRRRKSRKRRRHLSSSLLLEEENDDTTLFESIPESNDEEDHFDHSSSSNSNFHYYNNSEENSGASFDSSSDDRQEHSFSNYFDEYVSVFTGQEESCEDLICTATSFDSCSVTWDTVENETYYILVGNNNPKGTFDLMIKEVPSNDDCSGAIGIQVNKTYEGISTGGASPDLYIQSELCNDISSYANIAPAIWFFLDEAEYGGNDEDDNEWHTLIVTFYPNANITTEDHQEYTTSYNNGITIFKGSSCDRLYCLANNDIGPNTEVVSSVAWKKEKGVSPSSKYYFLVYGYGGSKGTFQVRVEKTSPKNDSCNNAIPIEVANDDGNIVYSGSTSYAWPNLIPSCDNAGGNLILLHRNDSNIATVDTTTNAVGQDVAIEDVDNSSSSISNSDTMLQLEYNTSPGVWYSIVGTGNRLSASLCNSSFDTTISLFAAATVDADDDGLDYLPSSLPSWNYCDSLYCIATNDDSAYCGSAGGLESEVSWESHLNKTYYIFIHGYRETDVGNYSLSIT